MVARSGLSKILGYGSLFLASFMPLAARAVDTYNIGEGEKRRVVYELTETGGEIEAAHKQRVYDDSNKDDSTREMVSLRARDYWAHSDKVEVGFGRKGSRAFISYRTMGDKEGAPAETHIYFVHPIDSKVYCGGQSAFVERDGQVDVKKLVPPRNTGAYRGAAAANRVAGVASNSSGGGTDLASAGNMLLANLKPDAEKNEFEKLIEKIPGMGGISSMLALKGTEYALVHMEDSRRDEILTLAGDYSITKADHWGFADARDILSGKMKGKGFNLEFEGLGGKPAYIYCANIAFREGAGSTMRRCDLKGLVVKLEGDGRVEDVIKGGDRFGGGKFGGSGAGDGTTWKDFGLDRTYWMKSGKDADGSLCSLRRNSDLCFESLFDEDYKLITLNLSEREGGNNFPIEALEMKRNKTTFNLSEEEVKGAFLEVRKINDTQLSVRIGILEEGKIEYAESPELFTKTSLFNGRTSGSGGLREEFLDRLKNRPEIRTAALNRCLIGLNNRKILKRFSGGNESQLRKHNNDERCPLGGEYSPLWEKGEPTCSIHGGLSGSTEGRASDAPVERRSIEKERDIDSSSDASPNRLKSKSNFPGGFETLDSYLSGRWLVQDPSFVERSAKQAWVRFDGRELKVSYANRGGMHSDEALIQDIVPKSHQGHDAYVLKQADGYKYLVVPKLKNEARFIRGFIDVDSYPQTPMTIKRE